MFYIAVCDDEAYFRMHEEMLIGEYMKSRGYRYQIDTFQSGKELLKLKNELSKYDIIFLDVNMEEIDGLETARKIREITTGTYLVFVTAFLTYALEGYKVDAIRYLLKDDNRLEQSVAECLDTIIGKMDCDRKKQFLLLQGGKKKILIEDILYVESNLHRLIFYMARGEIKEHVMYEKLDFMEEELRQHGFCRIHKSFLVNLKYVTAVERYYLTVGQGIRLNIAKARYMDVRNSFISYQGEV